MYLNASHNAGSFLGLHLLLPADQPSVPDTISRAGHPAAGFSGRPAIGATAMVHLGGRNLVAQVDGGTGHSGKSSPDLHFGLGACSPGTDVQVDLRWRDASGQTHSRTLNLKPGWHTVLLAK